MNPISELRAMLAKPPVTEALTVVSSTPTSVTVSSAAGIRQIANNGLTYRTGDVVLVRDSVILGRGGRDKDLPVYFV